MTMGGEGSSDILMLLVRERLDAPWWEVHEVCKDSMAKSYIGGLEVGGVRGYLEATQNTLNISRRGVLSKSDE